MSSASLDRTIPALPVRDMGAAVSYYIERFGFEARHRTTGFAVLVRDEAVLHLWAASDESWRTRVDLGEQPIVSGAESFLAGTASCRIEVKEVAKDRSFEVPCQPCDAPWSSVALPTSRSPRSATTRSARGA